MIFPQKINPAPWAPVEPLRVRVAAARPRQARAVGGRVSGSRKKVLVDTMEDFEAAYKITARRE